MSKVCAAIKSKRFPNVYTRNELINMAVEKGLLTREVAQTKNKRELCQLLNIEWVDPGGKKAEPEEITIPVSPPVIPSEIRPPDYPPPPPPQIEDIPPPLPPPLEEPMSITPPLPPHFPPPILPIADPEGRPIIFPVFYPEDLLTRLKRLQIQDVDVNVPEPTEDSFCITRSALPLKEYQKKVALYMVNHRGLILAWRTGSGKTLGAVAATQCALDTYPNMTVLVVTPKSLQENFKKEMVAYGVTPRSFLRYEFITPAAFLNDCKRVGRPRKCSEHTFLVIDEAHYYRNYRPSGKHKTLGTIMMLECATQVKKVLLLTATPVYNRPSDILPLVAMIKGTLQVPLSQDALKNLTPDEFDAYFKNTINFQAPPTEDYPTFREFFVQIQMSPSHYEKYHKLELELEYPEDITAPWVFYSGVRRATIGLTPCDKCVWILAEVIKRLKSNDLHYKTLIYSAWKTHGVYKLERMFNRYGVEWVEITGELSKLQRARNVARFNVPIGAPYSPQILFITAAGGEGLDLKGVQMVVIMESLWNRPNEEQIMGRAIRFQSHSHLPPEKRHVDVYHLILVKPESVKDDIMPSADEILYKISRRKMARNNSFISRLERIQL